MTETVRHTPTDGGPAFPVTAENGLGHIADGMSLRDWFAGQAMIAALSTAHGSPSLAETVRACAVASYAAADAMLAERAKAEGRQP